MAKSRCKHCHIMSNNDEIIQILLCNTKDYNKKYENNDHDSPNNNAPDKGVTNVKSQYSEDDATG